MKKSKKKIVFFGTPDFAAGILDAMMVTSLPVVAVVTAPDKPAGRGRKPRQSAVKRYAGEKALPVLQPANLKSQAFLEQLQALDAGLFVVVAFRMLPVAVWQMPPLGTINLHASLLPSYRGAAPINWAIINGEKETGVTTFFINEKIDTGPLIMQRRVPIPDTDTYNAGALHDDLMQAGAELLIRTVEDIFDGKAQAVPQNPGDYSPAPKLTQDNTRIDWSAPLDDIRNFIRGLSPYPGAWTHFPEGDKKIRVKILSCSVVKTPHTTDPGTVLVAKENGKNVMKVAHRQGYVYIREIKWPGKRSMDMNSFLNGYRFDFPLHLD